MSPVVCEWRAWNKYLIEAVLPDAQPVSLDDDAAAPRELAERALAAAPGGGTVLLHINLSSPGRILAERSEFLRLLEEGGARVWNAGVLDITKDHVQRHCAEHGFATTRTSRTGPADERLIVKSNLNAKGIPEGRLSDSERATLGVAAERESPIAGHSDYPVLRRDEIPAAWWDDARLFIERFVSNQEGRFFRFYLAGEKCVLSSGTSADAVRRIQNGAPHVNFLMRRVLVGDPSLRRHLTAGEIRAFETGVRFSESYRLDYGALDLVMDDAGEVYVVDVNLTPWAGGQADPSLVEHLRAGFHAS